MSDTIFVRGPNWVGDVVMSTPVLRALRRTFPDGKLLVGLRDHLHPLLEGAPFVDDLVSAPASGLFGRLGQARRLRKRDIDLGILLTNSFGSALELYLARVPRRRGYSGDGRSFLLSERVQPESEKGLRKPKPMTQFYADIVEGLGCVVDDLRYELPVSAADEAEAREFLERRGLGKAERLVGLNPGTSFGESKLWPGDRFARLADVLRSELGVDVVLLGGPGEVELIGELAACASPPLPGDPADVLGLGGLKALIRDLALLVTTDSGPRAIAQAFEVPQVVLMGPTDPRWTDLNGELAEVLRHEVRCGPCHQPVCSMDHACMMGIELDWVVAAVERRLDRA